MAKLYKARKLNPRESMWMTLVEKTKERQRMGDWLFFALLCFMILICFLAAIVLGLMLYNILWKVPSERLDGEPKTSSAPARLDVIGICFCAECTQRSLREQYESLKSDGTTSGIFF